MSSSHNSHNRGRRKIHRICNESTNLPRKHVMFILVDYYEVSISYRWLLWA